ncbi:hypothetical protein G5O_0052 [Chlamydia psittaci 6BC]|nr:hypothetical protein G5O_0052 [Chlamydia psittaci 6BC]
MQQGGQQNFFPLKPKLKAPTLPFKINIKKL